MSELSTEQIKELVDSQLLEFAPRLDGNGNIVSIDLVRSMVQGNPSPKIYVEGKEVNQKDFLDELNERLGNAYKMDYSKMESYIILDELMDGFEIK